MSPRERKPKPSKLADENRRLHLYLFEVAREVNGIGLELDEIPHRVATVAARLATAEQAKAELLEVLGETLDCLEQNTEDPDTVAMGIVRAALAKWGTKP